jgi:hypothetical protein
MIPNEYVLRFNTVIPLTNAVRLATDVAAVVVVAASLSVLALCDRSRIEERALVFILFYKSR